MASPRETLLDPALRVFAGNVAWYFLSDYYDGPISGLAIFQTRIVRFCCFPEDLPEQTIYVLQELSDSELAEEKRIKAKFERMVGTYGCFDDSGKLLPEFIGDDASKTQFFTEEKFGRPSTPYDRPIIAWFDISEK